MGRKITKLIIVWGLFIFVWQVLSQCEMHGDILHTQASLVHAQENVQYTYDSLGRVLTAVYPNGTTMIYEYDKNGNLLSIQMTIDEQNTQNQNTESENTENKNTENKNIENENTDNTDQRFIYNGHIFWNNGKENCFSHNTAAEIAVYNSFKKGKPVIKSLKVLEKKGKPYLKIQIRQMEARGLGSETGYQIKYSTSSSFKKAKTISVSKVKRGTLTKKQWKVTKNKTYYVKVRAYMKTRLGKTIYTKYSTTKKIKTSK